MLCGTWGILPNEGRMPYAPTQPRCHGHATHGGFLSHVALGIEGAGDPSRRSVPRHTPGRVCDGRLVRLWPTVRYERLAPGLVKPFFENELTFNAPVRRSTGAPLSTTRPGACLALTGGSEPRPLGAHSNARLKTTTRCESVTLCNASHSAPNRKSVPRVAEHSTAQVVTSPQCIALAEFRSANQSHRGISAP